MARRDSAFFVACRVARKYAPASQQSPLSPQPAVSICSKLVSIPCSVLDRRFDGEVHTHYEDDRWFGTRIKHRMKSNWLKMYDKFGLMLRIETVINNLQEFWVYRTKWHRDGTSSVGYYQMTKSVASLINYQEQALACNSHYLDTLAVVDDSTPAYQELRQLTEPKVVDGRSYEALLPTRFSAPCEEVHRKESKSHRIGPTAVIRG